LDQGTADVHFASRVAIQSLRAVVAFALLAISLLFAERFVFQRQIESANTTVQKILDAKAEILLSDEQLTMSAIAFAQSGDATWRLRYEAAMARFSIAVKAAASFAHGTHLERFQNEFGQAHEVMQEMEQLVIDLTVNNERADAVNVFTSPRYLTSKKTIETEINRLLAEAETAARVAAERAQLIAAAFVVTLVLLTIIGFAWLSRRLKRSLSIAENTFEAAQQAYLDQLAANHDAKLKSSRMEQLGTLTATLAHELRNPLGAVRTSSFMLERLWQHPDERIVRAFDRIKTGITRCDNLITQLLDFCSLGAPEKRQQNFDDWLENALQDMSKTLHATISLSCTLDAKDKHADMDPVQFKDALGKILTNASEAMLGRDGKRTTVNDAPPRIVVTSESSAETITLTITDNGHGIADGLEARVIEPFFTTKSFGAGLGLPAVRHIVEQHNGSLGVGNTPDGGVSVRLTLRTA
jgi:signal transduction histidine kinase